MTLFTPYNPIKTQLLRTAAATALMLSLAAPVYASSTTTNSMDDTTNKNMKQYLEMSAEDCKNLSANRKKYKKSDYMNRKEYCKSISTPTTPGSATPGPATRQEKDNQLNDSTGEKSNTNTLMKEQPNNPTGGLSPRNNPDTPPENSKE
jgi:hypothetical protein